MAIKFKELIRHGREQLVPGIALGFEDPDAEPYFLAVGWAEETDEEPVRVYSQEEIDIDPLTVYGDEGPKRGQVVLTSSRKEAAAPAKKGR